MPLLPLFAVLAFLPPAAPNLLEEPDYLIAREGERWVLRKPARGARQPFTISQHRDRRAAELRKRSLPRLRLSALFMRFDPVNSARTVIADWTEEGDARDATAEVREILNRFAPGGARALLHETPVYLARLFGATGHTAEESGDPSRFIIYLDPFRATGRLHAAATLMHEYTHLERYRARGFHANRAAAVLPKRDFVLLGLADEFAAFEAEAGLVGAFLDSQAGAERQAATEAIRNPALNWPIALSVLLGLEGPPDHHARTAEARRQVVLDVARNAGRYWDSHRRDTIDPELRRVIRDWYKKSPEWKNIEAERPEWRNAERLRGQQDTGLE